MKGKRESKRRNTLLGAERAARLRPRTRREGGRVSPTPPPAAERGREETLGKAEDEGRRRRRRRTRVVLHGAEEWGFKRLGKRVLFCAGTRVVFTGTPRPLRRRVAVSSFLPLVCF